MANNEVSVKVNVSANELEKSVTNDRFMLFVANEWKRLIDPYTPRDTGLMQDTAVLRPGEIEYIQPYASTVYYGENFRFKKKNPYSTHHWDMAAEQAGQAEKLARIANAALKSNQY